MENANSNTQNAIEPINCWAVVYPGKDRAIVLSHYRTKEEAERYIKECCPHPSMATLIEVNI